MAPTFSCHGQFGTVHTCILLKKQLLAST